MAIELASIIQPVVLLGIGFLIGRYAMPVFLTIRSKLPKKD